MSRFAFVCIAILLVSPITMVMGGEPVSDQHFAVQAVSATQTFADEYRFQPGEGVLLQRGELCIGGVQSPITVTRLIPEVRTRTYNSFEVQIVNGRPRVVPVQKTLEFTVFRLVSEQVTLTSPTIKGDWIAVDFPNATAWLFFAQEGSGIALGLGTTAGDQLQGAAFYLNFGLVPSGYYGLQGSREAVTME